MDQFSGSGQLDELTKRQLLRIIEERQRDEVPEAAYEDPRLGDPPRTPPGLSEAPHSEG